MAQQSTPLSAQFLEYLSTRKNVIKIKPGFSTSLPTVSLMESLRDAMTLPLRTLPGLEGSDGIGGGETGDAVNDRSPF